MITGASGFVGRHILQTLMQFEHKDLQIVAATRNPKHLPAEYQGEVRAGDLRDQAYLDRVLAGVDIICHAAGWTNYAHDDAASRKNYLEPTIDLINRAKEWRVSRFVNLSNIAVVNHHQRHVDDAIGQPRRGCAMFNNIIAVETYLKSQASSHMSAINLRTGIYCGQGVNTGLLPLLLQRPTLPLISGKYGYLPIVDGRDIGQAFARAALLPDVQGYLSLNITGPETPQQKTVIQFLHKKMQHNHSMPITLPAVITIPVHKLLQLVSYKRLKPMTTCAITASLANPIIDNTKARQLSGYQPQISWQASVEDFAAEFVRNTNEAGLFVEEKEFII
ncbi:MAG: NAD(P)-dependent oxidoreductase [Gammaproteobacteria bacterium]|nr:NAD(P)-dependent oxidoreductase [Gammaproteobacteria bacterium]